MFQIITFYKFILLNALRGKRELLRTAMHEHSIKGTIILANEGFNSTVCGEESNLRSFVMKAEEILGTSIEFKTSAHLEAPFRKIGVKIKPEIVTLKQEVDVSLGVGTHVAPEDWNAIITDPGTFVLDTRNDYEVMNGSFPGAANPGTTKFSELPDYVSKNLDPTKHKTVAMYCTGGIRCEKFAPYLKSKGFENVYQLQGGILKYLEVVGPSESLWNGECFVFDDRVTVDEKLEKGTQPDFSVTRSNGGEE
jgi:UPF0176 protein